MKTRQTLSAVLLTALIAGLAYFGISRGPVARQVSWAGLSLGQSPVAEPVSQAKPVAVTLPETADVAEADEPFPFRLKNTDTPIAELVRNETAVLLRNAFIDTALGSGLSIPAELKTTGDPLTYIAQARGPATAAFRRHIASSGGKIISYIPNNAYLVRLDAGGAARLANWQGTQSVLPFEPYYKLEMKLLEMTLTGQALPDGALINVVLFPESEPAAAQFLDKLGVEVLSQDRTPFGAKLVARVPSGKLAALARLTEVQGLERHRPRRLANDLTRPRLGVEVFTAEMDPDGTVTSVVANDYLALTGDGIYVNVNDSGVDRSHAAFGDRIKGQATEDFFGHGTFVAGIIAGDGSGSDTIKTNPPPGSFEDPDFKGMAPKATLHVLKSYDGNANNHISDRWLQTESATYNYDRESDVNVLISNNSWEYDDENDYTWAAASYDAATRDALPERPGDQQVIYVFPAGNSGEGSVNGLNASPNSVSAPGTAKNVITVGAIETLREIAIESKSYETNTVTETDEDGNELQKEEVTTTTNTPFSSQTDSENQVAYFSSRGNVGIGIEGQYGRFKPDLVAPGAFIISTKTGDWDDSITTSTNTLNGDEAFVYGGWRHRSEERAEARRELDEQLGDQYRYDSGTSVAAPAISGMLALMQEFYTDRLKRTNSPALMKALLINSAQSVDARYDHNVRGTVNHQGWGLPNLGRAVPALVDENKSDENSWPMRFIEQSLTNALATGESRSWEITLGSNALHYPIRFTLAWTDPPGNPNAAVKLVNDLDLIVTPISSSSDDPDDENTETEKVYYGNNIGASVYSSMGATNDVVNNVENVFIKEPAEEKYRITVYARRVNVDSLSAFYDAEKPADHVDVVQDFALVMSSANPEVGDAFRIESDKPEEIELPAITSLTNGMPMLHQRVGANSPLAKGNDTAHTVFANRSGIAEQWHFYTFTNAPPEKTNQSGSTPGNPSTDDDVNKQSFGKHVAFITFMSPNLSTPRHRDADVDLYVSRDSNLTNLEPAVLDAAFRSTDRGGTEYVIFDDAKVGKDEVFYIGVKSEDQMAAEFGLVGLSTDNANGFLDDDGNIYMLPLPAVIPDGSAANPGGVSIFGVYTGMPYDYVRKVTTTSIIHHEEVGDLWGQLSHDRDAVVLNDHTLFEGTTSNPYPTDFVFIYDDDPDATGQSSRATDGPGSLNDFKWQPAMGVWQFDMVDSALTFTGLVEHLNVKVDKAYNLNLAGIDGIDVTIKPNESEEFIINVPFNATNMIVELTDMSGPVDVHIQKGVEPKIDVGPDGKWGTKDDNSDYAKSTKDADLTKGEWDGSPSRGEMHYGINDSPPLSEGLWIVRIDNPDSINAVDFHIRVIFEYDISLDNTIKLVSEGPESIKDDTVNTSLLTVTNDFLVGSAEVGVRIDHPRIADLDLHLVSPQGTRLLLAENRGHTNISYGMTLTEESDTVPEFEDGFESADNNLIDDSAKFHSGWELDSGEVYAYRSGEVDGLRAHSGVQFLGMNGLEPGTISTNAVTETDKTYRLQFAYAKNPYADKPLEMKVFVGSVANLRVKASLEGANNTLSWQMQEVVFTAKSANTQIRFQSLETHEYAVMLDSVRLDEVTPANLYAVFSELENLAKASMKFGDAPYAKEEEQVLFSGFEGEPTGLAKTNDIIDGWTVLNNKVGISQNSKAHSGNYYATLSGDISQGNQPADDKQPGDLIWEFETGDDVYSSPAIGSDGTIYFGSNDNNLYAINPDGSKKWEFKTSGSVRSSPAIGSDSTIYVGSDDKSLHAIYPDGSKKWEFKTGDDVYSSPAIGSDSTIYVGSDDNNLYAINPNGSKKWEFKTSGSVRSSPAIGSDGMVYFGSREHKVYALDGKTGAKQWEFLTGANGVVFSSPAIGSDGTIYVGSYDKSLHAIKPDGSKKWEFKTGDDVYSSPAIGSDGTIYVGSDDKNLHAINPDGSKKWAFKTGDKVHCSPSIGSDGAIYVGSDDNNLYAIKAGGNKMGGSIWRDLPTAVGQDYRLSFATHASGDDAEYILGGVVTNRVDGAITLTKAIPESSDWVTNEIRFTAARSSTPLTIRTKSAAVQLDTIELIGPGPHNLAEEPLDVLSGERAMGDWVLEVRDHRVGVDSDDTEVEPVLVSWYIKIMGSEAEDTEVIPEGEDSEPYTRDDTAEALQEGNEVQGTIYEDETHYWTIETCSDTTRLTIELSTEEDNKNDKNAKISMIASYGGFPVDDSTIDDYIKVDMENPIDPEDDPFEAEFHLYEDSSHLPLRPGELLYLTVQKTDQYDTNQALYNIRATWNGRCEGKPPPNTDGTIRLANATGSESGLAKPGEGARFLWSIPADTPAALLEATSLTAGVDIELTSSDGRHFRNSIHLGQAPEQIVLREGDMIENLAGDWVVQVNAIGDAPSEFTLHTTLADEQGFLISSQPIELEIENQFWPPTVRLAWSSVPGERYMLESSNNLVDWVPLHEQTAGSSGVVFYTERSWFGECYYRVKQLTVDR